MNVTANEKVRQYLEVHATTKTSEEEGIDYMDEAQDGFEAEREYGLPDGEIRVARELLLVFGTPDFGAKLAEVKARLTQELQDAEDDEDAFDSFYSRGEATGGLDLIEIIEQLEVA
jgi:hypothetical protein